MFRTSLVIMGLALLGSPALAADGDAKAWAAKIAPFVDEETVLVARLDLSKVEPQVAFDKLAALLKLKNEHFQQMAKDASAKHAELKNAGVQEVFAVLSPGDFPDGPVLVVPLAANVNAADVSGLLAPGPMTPAVIRESLCVGSKGSIARMKELTPADRPEIEPALAAGGDGFLRIALIPSKNARRLLSELHPELPAELGGGSSKFLTEGVRWAALGIRATPQPRAQLVLQASDAPNARKLSELGQALLRQLAKQEKLGIDLPNLQPLASAITPTVEGDQVTLVVDSDKAAITKWLIELGKAAGETTDQQRRSNNFKMIGLAMHNSHDVDRAFPGEAAPNEMGKQLLSWRVHILPYLDANDLYKQFRLDEPWDSPHNKKLIEKMPAVYRSSSQPKIKPGYTPFLGVGGEKAMFGGGKGRRIMDVLDGTSNTVFVVEVDADHAVPWTKPEDWQFDPQNPTKGLFKDSKGNFLMLFVDGSVRTLDGKIDPAVLRAMFSINGGEVIPQP